MHTSVIQILVATSGKCICRCSVDGGDEFGVYVTDCVVAVSTAATSSVCTSPIIDPDESSEFVMSEHKLHTPPTSLWRAQQQRGRGRGRGQYREEGGAPRPRDSVPQRIEQYR